jgi:hypothetical protein
MSEATTDRIALDDQLQEFLLEVRAGQALALAAWASRVLKRGVLTMRELERCFSLGFEG